MQASRDRDPLPWCLAIGFAFLVVCLHRLGLPDKIYFDEVHYVKAARKLLQGLPANREHPMFAKEVIAASIALLGDRPWAWRIPSVLFGVLGLHAYGRFVWYVTLRRRATILAAILLATNFLWFAQSRIAMLDMVSAGLGMVALWQFAALIREPGRNPRLRLAACGIAMGLSLGAKWSIAPALALPGLTFLGLRLRANGWRVVGRKGAGPVPGISLAEAAFWLGLLPLALYWLTYLPGMFWTNRPIDPLGFVHHHQYMLKLQDSVKKLHPYRSVWYQWVINWRAIWYLYEFVDGAQRGILLIGNPFTMLAGLPALLWCLWIGIARRRWDALVFVVLYTATLMLWAVNGKPIQFYYHYLLPAAFLMACLALALDAIWSRADRWRWVAPAAMAVALGMFVYFYPIISAARLHHGKQSYAQWMWLKSWR
ncbi:dolichyl-phosphate-mannose--protein O-mannosyl transferase [Novosphingobium chloroacetimidivorans]|uniref:Polyprenol-phosphate-mannose--protein mannosyltransferase n=1 Tax=Novosphingobium chloroacetimidivorans TaxID=1428314 RepID=A0A7W7NXU0_9SPHN|nr:phospholipid carrier-dependent glycosyltransferase [Novosphingobium chloroacetimidivorans]MBB4859477.1 dolichyl-phosphate-mannose--protein O-mannosyl transferase [Novosphingobium chloroacetimidivorans]